MLHSLLLTFALSPAPAPAIATPVVAPLEVQATFDGRGRIHRVAAEIVDGRLEVSGVVTGPSPFPLSRRGVTIEALDASGSVIGELTVQADGRPARVTRRRPVTASFEGALEGVAGATSIRIRSAR